MFFVIRHFLTVKREVFPKFSCKLPFKASALKKKTKSILSTFIIHFFIKYLPLPANTNKMNVAGFDFSIITYVYVYFLYFTSVCKVILISIILWAPVRFFNLKYVTENWTFWNICWMLIILYLNIITLYHYGGVGDG